MARLTDKQNSDFNDIMKAFHALVAAKNAGTKTAYNKALVELNDVVLRVQKK